MQGLNKVASTALLAATRALRGNSVRIVAQLMSESGSWWLSAAAGPLPFPRSHLSRIVSTDSPVSGRSSDTPPKIRETDHDQHPSETPSTPMSPLFARMIEYMRIANYPESKR